MKIKVCGMKYADNIRELGHLPIDYMGFIFYPRSPRFVSITGGGIEIDIPETIQRVGVFVSETPSVVGSIISELQLDCVQLHGKESPVYCEKIKKEYPYIEVIKAFSISGKEDFNNTADYEGICDYFLFDTKTPQHGGSGQKFDWSILDAYTGHTPFLLSGGISKEDADAIKRIQHPQFIGVDLNSRFEIEPGLKNIEDLKQFITQLRS